MCTLYLYIIFQQITLLERSWNTKTNISWMSPPHTWPDQNLPIVFDQEVIWVDIDKYFSGFVLVYPFSIMRSSAYECWMGYFLFGYSSYISVFSLIIQVFYHEKIHFVLCPMFDSKLTLHYLLYTCFYWCFFIN